MSIPVDSTPDQVEDQVTEDLRLGLLLATQAAQQIVRSFNERQRETAAAAADRAHQFQAELQAHRALALAATRDVGNDTWWQQTSPRDMAHAWELARVWEGKSEPELADRAAALREGFADRYGITDPAGLTVEDLVNARGDEARDASPLDQAQWEARQYGAVADELAAERDRLTADLASQASAGWHPVDQRQFVTGAAAAPEVHDRREWLEARAAACDTLSDRARGLQQDAEGRATRLRGTGAATSTDRQWKARWDTPERREQLRARLQASNVPPDAMRARLLVDHAQGTHPNQAAQRPVQVPAARRPRSPRAQQHTHRR